VLKQVARALLLCKFTFLYRKKIFIILTLPKQQTFAQTCINVLLKKATIKKTQKTKTNHNVLKPETKPKLKKSVFKLKKKRICLLDEDLSVCFELSCCLRVEMTVAQMSGVAPLAFTQFHPSQARHFGHNIDLHHQGVQSQTS
jgi:hypothetical protein